MRSTLFDKDRRRGERKGQSILVEKQEAQKALLMPRLMSMFIV